ncbi:Hypothetical predicted protein [Olea europaea subsp. europaea]|uniref:Uncharacterized protein n=1 Tax=Olea europaea subsp. europaea TaxID=158383 RepID=A0A8S0SG32_OLEEU|nr:Hypothetical predicted protein [Olea europaea subsp. europaea]
MQARTALSLCFLFVSIRTIFYILWMDTYVTNFFFLSGQIWEYEAVLELGERFDQRVGERSPRLLCWTSTKQTQQPARARHTTSHGGRA